MPTVLVADDDRDVREVVVFKPEQSGYEVIVAEDEHRGGRVALERVVVDRQGPSGQHRTVTGAAAVVHFSAVAVTVTV